MRNSIWLSFAAGAAMLGLAGCTHVAPAPLGYLTTHEQKEVWIVRADNDSTVRVFSPRAENDTLMGFVGGTYEEFGKRNIKQLRAKQTAPVRTALLVIGITGATVVAFNQVFLSGNGSAIAQGVGNNICGCDFDDVCC